MINVWLQNRDLLTTTRSMVACLKQADQVGRITIVDCGSTFPDLLDWYSELKDVRIIRDKNIGNKAIWQHCKDTADYFASDADLDITSVPTDFLVRLRTKLRSSNDYIKVGLALRIDDLPDHNPDKADIIDWESQFWSGQKSGLSEWNPSLIDTTAAVYYGGRKFDGVGPALRLGGEYAARHVLWYLDPHNLPNEWKWYLRHLGHGGALGWSPRMKRHAGL